MSIVKLLIVKHKKHYGTLCRVTVSFESTFTQHHDITDYKNNNNITTIITTTTKQYDTSQT